MDAASLVVCVVAGGLLARAVFWHMPRILWMMYKQRRVTDASKIIIDQPPVDALWHQNDEIMSRHEARLYFACPSAFWLDPSRWERPLWPRPPSKKLMAAERQLYKSAVAQKQESAYAQSMVSGYNQKMHYDIQKDMMYCAMCCQPSWNGTNICGVCDGTEDYE